MFRYLILFESPLFMQMNCSKKVFILLFEKALLCNTVKCLKSKLNQCFGSGFRGSSGSGSWFGIRIFGWSRIRIRWIWIRNTELNTLPVPFDLFWSRNQRRWGFAPWHLSPPEGHSRVSPSPFGPSSCRWSGACCRLLWARGPSAQQCQGLRSLCPEGHTWNNRFERLKSERMKMKIKAETLKDCKGKVPVTSVVDPDPR